MPGGGNRQKLGNPFQQTKSGGFKKCLLIHIGLFVT
jgi:hypothetical protein